MKIYVDYVFFINFLFDFILLSTINIILKRNISYKRIVVGAIYGGITTFILYLRIPSIIYFILKILTGLTLSIITFKFKDIKYTLNNFIYLIIISIILGGSLYLINEEIGYSQDGILYFSEGKVLNLIILLFLFILISIIIINISKKYKKEIKTKYEIIIFNNKKQIKLQGFLDTGNKLYDPYFNKPINILNNNIKLDLKKEKVIYVPFNTLNSKGLMKCYLIDKIYIKGIGYKKNILLGITNDKFHLSGVDIIIHEDLLED